MKYLIPILLVILSTSFKEPKSFTLLNIYRDTVPNVVPQLFGGKLYEFGNYVVIDSFLMVKSGDTFAIPRWPAIKYKTSDNRWYGYYTGSRWRAFLNGTDTISLSNRINSAGPTLNNIGSGYRWVATSGGNIKTAFGGNTVLIDSSSNSNALTFKADTTVLATQYDLTQQNLQQVTDYGNNTTNDIIIGSRTNSIGRFSVEKTFTSLNVHAFDDYSTLNPSSGGFGFGVYDASTTMIGSQTNDHFVGFQSRLTVSSTTNINGDYGLTGLLVFNHHIGSGTITNSHGIFIKATNGGGPITNAYGLRIESVNYGTNNYSIFSDGGKVIVRDEVLIGGHTTPIAKLDVRNSSYDQTLYCDNTKANGYAGIFNASNGSGGNVGLDVTASGGTGNRGINFGNAMVANDWNIYSAGTSKTYIAGKVGLGSGNTTPTAALHLPAGSATANTAPLKFISGTNLTTPEDGAVEYNGTHFYVTIGSTRYQLDQQATFLVGTATLDFPSTNAGTSSDLTITVTGAVDGDVVAIGVPNGSTVANGCFTAWVSAANTVTVRFSNNDAVTAYNPASGTFKANIIR